MKKNERIAVSRILVDLIMADTVIDAGEMEIYPKLKNLYGISIADEVAANTMTLGEAVSVMESADPEVRTTLMQNFADVTVSDGFCARSEALLMIALQLCLNSNSDESAEVISVESYRNSMEDNQVLYVESQYDEDLNNEIKQNYRQINRDLKLSGFDFVYIPYVASHYKKTPPEMLRRIVSFLSPNLEEKRLNEILSYVSDITTCEFCKEQIGERISALKDCNPSLLFKIGKSYVGDRLFENFLRVEISEGILRFLPGFIDDFTSMLSSDIVVVPKVEEGKGQFLYSGFYKQIFDIYLNRHEIRSTVVIDTQKAEISFPEINAKLDDLHRREKALYVLFMVESLSRGGVSLTKPKLAKQMVRYNAKMKDLQAKYNFIYSLFGGDLRKVPDLSLPEIRNPMISLIKKQIEKFSDELYHYNDYLIEKNTYGIYVVNVDSSLLSILEKGEFVQLQKSKILSSIL